jgi:hypothetical protein
MADFLPFPGNSATLIEIFICGATGNFCACLAAF